MSKALDQGTQWRWVPRMPSLSERVAASRTRSEGALPSDGLDELAELMARLHHRAFEALGSPLFDPSISDCERRRRVLEVLEAEIEQERYLGLAKADRVRLLNEVSDAAVGYGPIDSLLKDGSVTELMVDGSKDVYYEKAGRLLKSEVSFVDEVHLRLVINKLLRTIGRRVDQATPMVDDRLPDGSSINAVVHPVAIGGPYLTIRKYVVDPFQEADLIAFGTLTQQVADFLHACVRARLNIIVSGARGSGKTTTLNVLSSHIGEGERIITLEREPELSLPQERVLTLTSRSSTETQREVTIRDLVENALHMIPDRVIVGEVRNAAALDLLQMMATGHDGCLATVNSESPRDTLSRIETMVLMADLELRRVATRELIASAVDLIVHVARLEDGTRRITHVTEVGGVQDGVVVLDDLFLFDDGIGVDAEGVSLGYLVATGIRPAFADALANQGVSLAPDLFDPGFRPKEPDGFSG